MPTPSLDQFIGGQFAWFTGVVEDNLDPKEMGRVRVRCFGYHTDDKSEIPTESLPWALVMLPITSSSMSGVGRSATGVERGSWVVGFFRDGASAQDPLVIGTIPAISTGGPPSKGFSDPFGENPTRPGQVDTPIEAKGNFQTGSTFVRKTDLRQEKIETAVPPKVSSVAPNQPESYYTRNTWSNWKTEEVINPVYPQNHVWHTKSGHVLEFDDSVGARRISEMHASGTYREINNSGDQTLTVVGGSYRVVFKDDNVYIKGNCNLTVDGNLRTLVKGNYHLEVEGDMTEYVKGSHQVKIGKSEQKEIGQERATNTKSNHIERVGGDTTIIRDGNKSETTGGQHDATVTKDENYIVLGKNVKYVGGDTEFTTSGHLYVTSQDNIEMETPSDMKVKVDGSLTETVVGSQTTDITGAISITSGSTVDIEASGNVTIKGAIVDLNP